VLEYRDLSRALERLMSTHANCRSTAANIAQMLPLWTVGENARGPSRSRFLKEDRSSPTLEGTASSPASERPQTREVPSETRED
jgi:hypothetical protein